MSKLSTIDWVTLILVLIGALNWGLIGLFNFDLVAMMFGDMSAITRIIYVLVGLSAVYILILSPQFKKD